MSKILIFKKLLVFLLIILLFPFLFLTKEVLAQNVNIQCPADFKDYVNTDLPPIFPAEAALGQPFDVTVNFGRKADTNWGYYVRLTHLGTQIGPINLVNVDIDDPDTHEITGGSIVSKIPGSNTGTLGVFKVRLMHRESTPTIFGKDVCTLGFIDFFDPDLNNTQCDIRMPNTIRIDQPFGYNIEKNELPGIKFFIYFFRIGDINVDNLPNGVFQIGTSASRNSPDYFKFAYQNIFSNIYRFVYRTEVPANDHLVAPPNLSWIQMTYDNSGSNHLNGGDYMALLEVRKDYDSVISGHFFCSTHPFSVVNDRNTDPPDQWTPGRQITKPGFGGTVGGGQYTTETCKQKAEHDKTVKCTEAGAIGCSDDPNNPQNPGIQTAIGCVHTKPAAFVKDLVRFATGIAGGIAFLMMIFGAFQMLTSAGNPDTLHAGRDRFTNAIIGLLIIVFAVLLLQIIGVDILKIPGIER